MIYSSLIITAAFFLGAVPFGLIIARLTAGIDIRTTGSGNIGATNVARTLGAKFGVATLVLDLGKGLAPVLAAQAWLGGEGSGWVPAAAGLAAFFGHIHSPFLGFSGGKGVATALGVYLGLAPFAVVPALAVFLFSVMRWRYVSVGSMSAAVAAAVATWLLDAPGSTQAAAAVIAVFIILRHGENIGRLTRGEEKRWGSNKGD
ncbi:MAG: glycerol-3-phosphate 1-O-acyltransferase PlsY [Pseudomonadota bacterium]